MQSLFQVLSPGVLSLGWGAHTDPYYRVGDKIAGLLDVVAAQDITNTAGNPIGVQLRYALRDSIEYSIFLDCRAHVYAMIQTLGQVVRVSEPVSWPWLYVHLYYASFFSVQASLRSVGRGVVYLGHEEVNPMNVFLKRLGVNGDLRPGCYAFAYDANSNELRIEKTGARMHELAWREYYSYLSDSVDVVLPTLGATEAKDLRAVVLSMNEICHGGTGCKSMSEWRNGINYRVGEQQWGRSRGEANLRSKLYANWRISLQGYPNSSDEEVHSKIALVVCRSAYELLLELNSRCAALDTKTELDRVFNKWLPREFKATS